MNKIILSARLVQEPEIRYSQSAEPIAFARYTLAVNRRFKRQGEPDADFFNCVAFAKNAEFAEKYLTKGQLINIVGRLQNRSWTDQNGQKRTITEVIVEEQYFAESKESSNIKNPAQQAQPIPYSEGFYPVDEGIEDDSLPF